MSKLTLHLPTGAVQFPVSPELAMMVAEIMLRKTPGAEEELEQLVAAGCERERLLFDLGNLLRDADLDTWPGLLGFDRKQTQAAVRRMRKSAGDQAGRCL